MNRGEDMKKTRYAFGIVSMLLIFTAALCKNGEQISAVRIPPVDVKNDHYISNREPLLRTPFIKLPVGLVKPKGWLLRQLQLQADGFHGHLDEISEFLKKENNAWLNPDGKGERGWEEEPYWLKGFSNCGYLLGDERMIKESLVWIEGALRSRQPDGWFGPAFRSGGAATKLKGRTDLWPNMIMLFCLQDYYEYTGSKDKQVISLMTDYFKYLSGISDEDFLKGYWPRMRAGDMLFSVIWLYNRTGEKWLVDFARKVHRNTAGWEKDVINWHNVNISQGFGENSSFGAEYEFFINDYENPDADEYKSHKPSVFLSYWFTPQWGLETNASCELKRFDLSDLDEDTWEGDIRLIKQRSKEINAVKLPFVG